MMKEDAEGFNREELSFEDNLFGDVSFEEVSFEEFSFEKVSRKEVSFKDLSFENLSSEGYYLFEDTQLEKAKQVGLKYVAARMHTCYEVKQHLQKKGFDNGIIREVIAFLESYHYLDDEAYCRSWIHDRIQFHPCGRQKMSFELAKKITDRQLIQQSLEEYFPEETEYQLAVTAAEKKLDGSRAGSTREQIARFLYTRGFGGSLINRVLQEESIQNKIQKKTEEDF